MKINIQIIASLVRQLGAIAFITTLAWSVVVLSAPAATTTATTSQQQQQQQPQQAASSTGTTSSSSSANVGVAKNALTSLLQSVNAASSQASPRDGATSASADSNAAAAAAAYEDVALNTFDGKNPFTDDSLWQIPIHLTRDSESRSQSAGGRGADQMAKSASQLSTADEQDNNSNNNNDDDVMADEPETTSLLAHQKSVAAASASSSPTIISASTTGAGAVDLKTAAGYHHATPHHHAGYGHQHGGHDAGHYDGAHHDHYGKYFQYASVPYPYAWDFGYRRGNPYHTIERYEHGKGPHFQTKVKWADKYGGYGVHVWDYNHDDHHSHHYGGGHHDSHGPSHHYGGGHH